MSAEQEKKEKRVDIGVGVVIFNNKNEVLMIKRKGVHGAGEWAFPGGSVKFGEAFEQAAKRELEEELGLEAEKIQVISLSNQLRYLKDGVHCVIIGIRAEVIGEPVNKEPEKIEEIGWFSLDNLPGKMFEGSEQIARAIKSKKFYISN